MRSTGRPADPPTAQPAKKWGLSWLAASSKRMRCRQESHAIPELLERQAFQGAERRSGGGAGGLGVRSRLEIRMDDSSTVYCELALRASHGSPVSDGCLIQEKDG